MKLLFDLGLLSIVGAAGISHFGVLEGLGIAAAVYMLMPYQAVYTKQV